MIVHMVGISDHCCERTGQLVTTMSEGTHIDTIPRVVVSMTIGEHEGSIGHLVYVCHHIAYT